MSATIKPLSGVRIADFTWIGAGSFTTKLLADFGADVIKIESATRLDTLRDGAPFKDGIRGVNRSGYFADRNSSKRSVTIDMKRPEGQALARKLIARSDVVANNFTPGTMEKFGLGYEAVRAIREDIIYIAMSMQGSSGPEHKYLGYGLTIGALTGLQYLSGLPDRQPAGTGTNFPDHIPNPCHAAFAILAALRHRRRSGQGQMIDMAQTEPMISLLGPAVAQWTANGDVPDRRGNQHVAGAPHGVYPCAGDDRWIAISAIGPAAWSGLIQVLGLNSLGADERLLHANVRWARRAEIDRAIAGATKSWDAEKLMSALQEVGVAAGVVRDAAEIVTRDPQLQAREHWVSLQHPEMGKSIYNAPAYRMSGVETGPYSPAPLLGQHTEEVCRDVLELKPDEISALVDSGVLR
jgi:benzylsuccinate CoA-transferase BbsF subunit